MSVLNPEMKKLEDEESRDLSDTYGSTIAPSIDEKDLEGSLASTANVESGEEGPKSSTTSGLDPAYLVTFDGQNDSNDPKVCVHSYPLSHSVII